MELIMILVVVGTSIWVLADSVKIGAKKGILTGIADIGPGGWFCASLMLWIVAFPLYLAKRSEIVAAVARDAEKKRERPLAWSDQVQDWHRKKFIVKKRAPSNGATLRPAPRILIASVDCPVCAKPISLAAIRIGKNVCPECGEAFAADAG